MTAPGSGLPEIDRRDEKFLALCGTLARIAAALVILAGSLNLFGWIFDRSLLPRISPHGAAMRAGTALAFILAGASLWLSQERDNGRFARTAADSCAFALAFSGALVLAGYAAGRSPGMTPHAALIFALSGGSLLLSRRPRGGFAASCMAVCAGAVALLGIMGYVFEAEALAHFGPYGPISFQTALAGLVLAAGVLVSMRDRGLTGYLSLDGDGSVMARRLLPAVVLVPVLFGLLSDWSAHAGLKMEAAGEALMAAFGIFALAAVVWVNARMLDGHHRERVRAEQLRERHERELARTANLLEKIFSNIHLKVAYMDPEFNILRVNKAFADSGGHPPEHYIGRNHFDLYPHEENEAIFRKVVETGESYTVYSKVFEYPDQPGRGKTYWDWTLQPVKDEDDAVAGLVLSLVDVTERVRAESLLREKEEAGLRQDKMALLGAMATGIVHEVRNPLSGLNFSLATAETVCDEAQELDPERRDVLKRALASARSASTKIGEVIRRVTNFARPGQGVMGSVSVNEAVREALALVSPTLRKKGVRVSTPLCEDLPRCRGDLHLIEQLLLNLIKNASEAMEGKDGERTIEISSRAEKGRVIVAVSDSGPGVSGPLQEKIFSPFYTTRPEGSGLGLSVSRKIAADHGGTIAVGTSRFGGAEFSVSLPALTDDIPGER